MKKTSLKPAKNIVILQDVVSEKMDSGIELYKSVDAKKPEKGIVVAVGGGTKPVEFVVGDLIYYERYLDNRIQHRGEEYNFIKFEKILAVESK